MTVAAVQSTCSAAGCDRQSRSRRLCGKHYQEWYRTRRPDGFCRFPDCRCKSKADGLCGRHYERVRRTGDLGPAASLVPRRDPTADTKTCTRCGEAKSATEYYVDPRRPGFTIARCKSCIAETTRDAAYKRRYGLSTQEVQEKCRIQNWRCAACGAEDQLVVDHCHVSGRVRDMLCDPCNRALGTVNDDAQRLRRLAEYVERHQLAREINTP